MTDKIVFTDEERSHVNLLLATMEELESYPSPSKARNLLLALERAARVQIKAVNAMMASRAGQTFDNRRPGLLVESLMCSQRLLQAASIAIRKPVGRTGRLTKPVRARLIRDLKNIYEARGYRATTNNRSDKFVRFVNEFIKVDRKAISEAISANGEMS